MANPITKIILTAVDRTKAAFGSVKGGLDSIGNSALGLNSAITSIFAGLSVLKIAGDFKLLIDRMDKAGESAERIGTSTANFTALGYAAKLSASSTEELEDGLLKLSRSLDAAKSGAGPAAEAFKALRIDPAQFSDPSDALLALSERFAEMPNGVNKTALAMAIFGKTGANLIPMLNQGRDGIARLTDEARELGEVFDDEASGAAGRFNDNLDRLKASSAGLGITVATKLMPSLNQYLGAMDDVIRKGSLIDKVAFFGAGFISEETLNRISDAGERVQDYNVKIAELQQQLVELRRVEGEDSPNVRIWEDRIAALEKTRGTLIAAEKKANADREKSSDETSASIIGNYEDEARAFRKSTGEKISDAERLKDALNSAFSQALGEEEQYTREAARLRAKASSGPSGESEESTRADATIEAMKLQRLKENGNPEEIRAQASAVRDLASQLEDQEYAAWLVTHATLAEAKAAEISAAAARERAEGLAEQMRANDARLEGYGKVVEEVNKPVALDIVSTAQTEASLSALREAKGLIEFINSTPLKLGVAPGELAGSLRTTALQFGRRG